MSGNLIQANAIQIPLKDESVQLCVFSPPYWKLRKYKISDVQFPDGYTGQLGLEPSIDLFLDHMMLVMEEVWRILRDDGICFVNISDTYASAKIVSSRPVQNVPACGNDGKEPLNLKGFDPSCCRFCDGCRGGYQNHQNHIFRNDQQLFLTFSLPCTKDHDSEPKDCDSMFPGVLLPDVQVSTMPGFFQRLQDECLRMDDSFFCPFVFGSYFDATQRSGHTEHSNHDKLLPNETLVFHKQDTELSCKACQESPSSIYLHSNNIYPKNQVTIRPKSLCLVPQKFAIRCQEAGWIVRSEIIWHKLNPMPESCKDRPTKSHEQVWMLTKTGKYFWDQEAVAQPQAEYERVRRLREKRQGHKAVYVLQADNKTGQTPQSANGTCRNVQARQELAEKGTRNIRTVWTLPSESCPEAHFATWPSKLVEIMVRAGSSPRACEICGAPWERIVEKTFIPQEDVSLERGIRCCPGQKPLDETDNRAGFPRGSNKTKILSQKPTCKCDNKGLGKCVVADIFCGVGTTVLVAEKLGRTGVGLDLSSEYLWDIARKKVEAPMQKEMF